MLKPYLLGSVGIPPIQTMITWGYIYIYIWICDISFSIKRTRNINRTIERCCFPMFLQTFLQEVTSPLFPSGKEFPFKKICEYASNRDRPAWPCLADRAGVIHGSSLCSSSNSSNKFGFQRAYIYIYILYIVIMCVCFIYLFIYLFSYCSPFI